MKANKFKKIENTKLLMDIVNLKIQLNELYSHKGPNTSEYVSVKINLDKLMNEYFEEKITQLI
jgi:hypothetical protein